MHIMTAMLVFLCGGLVPQFNSIQLNKLQLPRCLLSDVHGDLGINIYPAARRTSLLKSTTRVSDCGFHYTVSFSSKEGVF